MKLRNKHTGETTDHIWWDSEVDELCIDGKHMNFYGSLAELNADWEDIQEDLDLLFSREDGDED